MNAAQSSSLTKNLFFRTSHAEISSFPNSTLKTPHMSTSTTQKKESVKINQINQAIRQASNPNSVLLSLNHIIILKPIAICGRYILTEMLVSVFCSDCFLTNYQNFCCENSFCLLVLWVSASDREWWGSLVCFT